MVAVGCWGPLVVVGALMWPLPAVAMWFLLLVAVLGSPLTGWTVPTGGCGLWR